MKTTLGRFAVAVLLGAILPALPARSQDAVPTDAGTLDKESAERAHPKSRPYSPYAGRNFPSTATLVRGWLN